MDTAQQRIARRYAQAYCNVFGDDITPDSLERLVQLVDFLSTQKRILFFFRLPTLDHRIKEQGIATLCERYQLPESFKRLGALLVEHKRAFLLANVSNAIVREYNRRQKRERFTITSYPELQQSQKSIILASLAAQTGSTVEGTFTVDEKLIAGIRMRSDVHMWESSLAQQIRCLQLSLMR